MKKVFLSASHNEWDKCRILADALAAEGIDVFTVDRLSFGKDLHSEILSEIKQCDVLVAILGNFHLNVIFEVGYALGSNKSILLLRGQTKDMPSDIASFPSLAVDYSDPRSILDAVSQIKLATVNSHALSRPRNFKSASEKLQYMAKDESFLDQVKPLEFEECIANCLIEKGFGTGLVFSPYDRGFDIEIHNFFESNAAIVEAKKRNRNSRLSVSDIQKTMEAATATHAHYAIIVTSGTFTTSARHFADLSPMRILLLTIDDLINSTKEDLIHRCIDTSQSISITGETPGAGTYVCINCGITVMLDEDSDKLPPCPHCYKTAYRSKQDSK